MSDEDEPPVQPSEIASLVLVVDDELTPRSIVARMVRTLGYPARSCPSGQAALRFMAHHPGVVRLLLADLAMPRMDGGELAERARELEPKLQVVLMAGAADPYVDALLEGYADVPFLPKPVSLGALAELLESLLGAATGHAGTPPSMTRRGRVSRPSRSVN